MNRIKKDFSERQLDFDFSTGEPDLYLEGIEDIFGPADIEGEEEEKRIQQLEKKLLGKEPTFKAWKLTEKGMHYLEKHSLK